MAEIVVKIRPALTALKIGESITFPISKLKSVRTQASPYGFCLYTLDLSNEAINGFIIKGRN